jgi:hypothetical protein
VSGENGYNVEVDEDGGGWRVRIVGPSGVPVAERVCRDEPEARTYASTVNQHIYWLSEQKFRRYYRLPDPETEQAVR